MFRLVRNTRQFLIDRIPPGAVCAEIGVWKGDFSEAVARGARPAQLHLIDPWLFRPSFPARWYGGARAASQADMDAIHDGVVTRMAAFAGVNIHRRPSVEAAATFPDGAFDWIYIDGDHSCEAVAADLECWWPKLKTGGTLAGDDYHWKDETGTLSVKRAVDAFTARKAIACDVRRGQFLAVKSAA